MDKSEREQKNRNTRFVGNDLSHLEFGDSLALDVVRQADLGKSWKLGLDRLIETAAAFSSHLVDPLL